MARPPVPDAGRVPRQDTEPLGKAFLSFIRTFFWSFIVALVGLAGGFWYGSSRPGENESATTAGITALFLVAILSILEISFSFDNAVINATILRRSS
jgi:hypothetical protein